MDFDEFLMINPEFVPKIDQLHDLACSSEDLIEF